MATLEQLRDALRERVRVKAPEEEADSIYKIPDEVLERTILESIYAHNPTYTIDTLPPQEVPFVMWLAEIEVYFNLASANSRYYSIMAEAGTQINRQERVSHYMRLIEGRQRHYDTMWAKFRELNPDTIQTGELIVRSPNTLHRAWRLSDRPSISLEVVRTTQTTADLQWSPYTKRRAKVSLYQHRGTIVDEWEIPLWHDGVFVPVSKDAKLLWSTLDPYRNKFRARDLKPGTKYHFAVVIQDTLGAWNYSEVRVETEAEEDADGSTGD